MTWQALFDNPLGRGTTLSPELVKLYRELAYAQRGEPEEAMSRAQRALGGGVLSFVIEHVGDLTNRMAKDLEYGSAGYEYVKDKVDKTLRQLEHRYGFEKEHEENMRSNAQHHGVSYNEHMRRVNDALQKYAEAHAQLHVYNKAQFLARNAAMALGAQDFNRARNMLRSLKRMLGEGEDKWWDYTTTPPDPKYVDMWPGYLPWEAPPDPWRPRRALFENPVTPESEKALSKFVHVLEVVVNRLDDATGAEGFLARQHIVNSIQSLNVWGAYSVILSSLTNYELTAPERKVLERGARFFSRRSIKIRPGDAEGQLVELHRQLNEYLRVLSRLGQKGKALSASNEGSFILINSGGFDAKTMNAMGKYLQKSGELLADKKLANICYGEVVLTKTVLRGHQVLAFYRSDEDRLYIRGNRRGVTADNMIHAIIHELGHRLYSRFLRPEQKRHFEALYISLEQESFKDAPPPSLGQRILERGKEYEVVKVSYSRVELVNLKTKVQAIVPLRAWPQVVGTSLFVTPYARKSPEENFCEMLTFYSMGRLETALPGPAGIKMAGIFKRILK